MSRGRYNQSTLAADYQRVVVDKGACNLEDPKTWIPLIKVSSFSSEGWRTMLWSHTSGRPLELMSEPEADWGTKIDCDPLTRSICEGAALNPVDTMRIAERKGVAHPADENGEPTIMSSDFVVLKNTSLVGSYEAISVKRAADITPRVLDKACIEKDYWAERQIPFRVVLDTHIEKDARANLRRLGARRDPEKVPATPQQIALIVKFLDPYVEAGAWPISLIGGYCDRAFGFERGTTLAVAWHLAAIRRWPVDIDQPMGGHLPFPLCNHHLN